MECDKIFQSGNRRKIFTGSPEAAGRTILWNDTREAPAAVAWAFRLFVRHCRNNIELRVKYEWPRGAPPAKPFFRFTTQYQAFSLGLALLTETGYNDSYLCGNRAI